MCGSVHLFSLSLFPVVLSIDRADLITPQHEWFTFEDGLNFDVDHFYYLSTIHVIISDIDTETTEYGKRILLAAISEVTNHAWISCACMLTEQYRNTRISNNRHVQFVRSFRLGVVCLIPIQSETISTSTPRLTTMVIRLRNIDNV